MLEGFTVLAKQLGVELPAASKPYFEELSWMGPGQYGSGDDDLAVGYIIPNIPQVREALSRVDGEVSGAGEAELGKVISRLSRCR